MTFEIQLEEDDNTLLLSGRFSFDNAKLAKLQGEELINTLSTIRIDLANVLQPDSSLLILLSAWMRIAKKQHKDICFCNLPRHLEDLIRVSGLDTILPIENI